MAHFAELNDINIVVHVAVVRNEDILAPDGTESELIGIEYLKNIFGQHKKWIQTSYNGSFRKNYAGIGYKYDSNKDAFIPPKPYDSWILNEETCKWESPISMPNDGKLYFWDEPSISWKEDILSY